MQDLARLHLFIARRLSFSSNCSVLPACDLLTGKGNTTLEEALAAFSSWGVVHGSGSNYTRMALCLVDSHFRKAPATAAATAQPPPAPLPKDLVRIRPLHKSPGWMPACPFRHCPASGPRPASNCLEAASCTSLCFRGGTRSGQRGGANPSFQKGSGSGQGTSGRRGR
jgi:hypothetical protein